MSQNIPRKSKGLVCHAVGQPLSVESVQTPEAVPGSVVIRVINAAVQSDLQSVLKGEHSFLQFPTPIILGHRGIGPVVAVGPDATSLPIGQLVLAESFIRARDNPDIQILWAASQGPSPVTKKLMKDAWLNGMYAEYARLPLENCYPLDEDRLLGSPADGGLGYNMTDLSHITVPLVAYGGLRSISLRPGETVIIAPATGAFSGGAIEGNNGFFYPSEKVSLLIGIFPLSSVRPSIAFRTSLTFRRKPLHFHHIAKNNPVASAIGARVIALSRNLESLQQITKHHPKVTLVQTKGDIETDTRALLQLGPIDAYLDLSPAISTTHIRSCLAALKPYGRAWA